MESLYDGYKHLLEIDYVDGLKDCYGLCRQYLADVYEVDIPNYARSADFPSAGIDMLTPFLEDAGFVHVNVALPYLQRGDGLLLSVPVRDQPRDIINHVGIFVGNQLFIHHIYKKKSCEDPMDLKWSQRVRGVLRHPEVTAKNNVPKESKNILDLLPDHVKRRHGIEVT